MVILGILAAIVMPQFSTATQNARQTSVQTTLQSLRSQIQLYKMQHGEQLPNLVADWTPLTTASSYGGQNYAPYLPTIAVNPLNGLSTVSDATGNLNNINTVAAFTALMSTNTNIGFLYDYESGAGSGLIFATDSTGAAIAGGGNLPF